jgi:hypothetical protein
MSRVFVSHSSRDSRQAMAVKVWLIEHEPGLANAGSLRPAQDDKEDRNDFQNVATTSSPRHRGNHHGGHRPE